MTESLDSLPDGSSEPAIEGKSTPQPQLRQNAAEYGGSPNDSLPDRDVRVLVPVVVLAGGVVAAELAFWVAGSFESMFKDLGQKLPRATVIALQVAALGRSTWGISIVLGIVAILSLSVWRTRSRALGFAMLCLGVLGGACVAAYAALLFLPFMQITRNIK